MDGDDILKSTTKSFLYVVRAFLKEAMKLDVSKWVSDDDILEQGKAILDYEDGNFYFTEDELKEAVKQIQWIGAQRVLKEMTDKGILNIAFDPKSQDFVWVEKKNPPRVLSYAEAHRWEPLAKARGVSAVETAGSIDPKYVMKANPMKLPLFTPLPGFPRRPSGKKLRRNPLHPKTAAYFDALERIAGQKQVMYFGPWQIVGDRKGGILGKLELHFPHWAADGGPIVHIGYIGVDAANRGKGNGTRLMQMLIQAADEVGLDMDLDISPQKERDDKKPPMNATQLHRFYSKFGFVSESKSMKKKMKRTR